MALKRRTRAMVKATISESLRYYLETGNYCLRDLFPDDPRGKVEVFKLAYSSEAMRKRLKSVWLLHRSEVMAGWKKRGRPWAARQFE